MRDSFAEAAGESAMPCGCTLVDLPDGETFEIRHSKDCTSTAVLPLDRLARKAIEQEAKEAVDRVMGRNGKLYDRNQRRY
jgi:hypothetical protein